MEIRRSILRQLLVLFLAASSTVLSAQTTSIPDPVFEQYLLDEGYDSDGILNGEVLTADISGVTSIQMWGDSYPGLTDLTGLEDFPNLTFLSVYNQSSLGGTLDVSQNTNLTSLDFSYTQVNSVDFSNNPLLTFLDGGLSPIANVDLSANPLLQSIYLGETYLTSIILPVLPNLHTLVLGTQVDLNTASLDLSGSPLLNILTLAGFDDLTSLDLSANTAISQLTIKNCSVVELDLSANTNLAQVWVFNDISYPSQLTSLNLKNGNNSSMSNVKLTGHDDLFCVLVDNGADARNDVGVYGPWQHDSHVLFGETCNLTYVPDDVFEQYLIDEGYDDMLNDYVLTDLIQGVTSIQMWGDSYPGLTDLTGLEDFPNLTFLSVYNQSSLGGTLDVSQNTNLTSLDFSYTQVNSVDFSNNPLLTFLDGGLSPIANVDLSANPLLQSIYLGETYLTSIILPVLPNLHTLVLGTQVDLNTASLDLSGSPLLNILTLDRFYDLTSLDLSANTAITQLSIRNCSVVDLDLSANTNLSKVWVFNDIFSYPSQLTSLNLKNGNNSSMSNVKLTGHDDLFCVLVDNGADARNDVGVYGPWQHDSHVLFGETCNLTYVPDDVFEQYLIDEGYDDMLNDYVLTDLIVGVTSIQMWGGSYPGLTDLTGLEDFPNLTFLSVFEQSSLSGALDVSQNPNLTSLDFSYTQVNSVDFSNNPLLTFLDGGLSPIANVDLSANPLMQSIYLGDTYLTSIILPVLPNLHTLVLGTQVDLNTASLDLSGSPLLNTLTLDRFDDLTSLDLSANTAISQLTIRNCSVVELDLSANTNLAQVWVFNDIFSYPSQLTSLNLKNGNNSSMSNVKLTGHDDLTCIVVDNAADAQLDLGAYASWQHDIGVIFNEFQSGCTDPLACNYNPLTCTDDGSCFYPDGCTDIAACNFTPGAQCDDESCVFPGCVDVLACNYDSEAGCDSGICYYAEGCTDSSACNYDSAAGCDDGSCVYPNPGFNCAGDPLMVASCFYATCDRNEEVCGGFPVYLTNAGVAMGDDYSDLVTVSLSGAPAGMTFNDLASYDIGPDFPDDFNHLYVNVDGTFVPGAYTFDLVFTRTDGVSTSITLTHTTSLGVVCDDSNACNYNPGGNCNGTDDCVYSGCTDVSACNYDSGAGCDDGSCIVPDGCTDSEACNYNPGAFCDDGSCIYQVGCTDIAACNFIPGTLCDDGSCVYPGCMDSQACNYNSAAGCDGICIYPDGCTDPFACNYLPAASCDDGSCVYPGCMDSLACNYDSAAGCDASCIYPDGCTDPIACNYLPAASCDDGSCVYPGCMDSQACNYDSAAGCDAICIYPDGCTDPVACNYGPAASCDDGSCEYASCNNSCPADLNDDNVVNTIDLLAFLGVFSTSCDDPGCQGDLNLDGEVNTIDLLEFLSAFGSTCP